jgi:hypothetical protein
MTFARLFVLAILSFATAASAVAPRARARARAAKASSAASSINNGMAAGTIAVLKATWGGKDVTKLAQDFCDGQLICDYKIDTRFIGEPVRGTTFSLTWACKGGAPQTKSIDNAEGQLIPLKCAAPNSPMTGWTSRSALNYPESFHAILRHPKEFPGVDKYISDECLTTLSTYIGKGGTFARPEFKRFFAPLSKMQNAESADLQFFHYTKAAELKTVVQHQKTGEALSYLRTNANSSEQWYLYVAADPASSSEYGDIQIRLYFKPSTLVFYAVDDGPAGEQIGASKTKTFMEDTLVGAHPELEACRNQGYSNDRYQAVSVLDALAAEAHGASLIAYYGVDNAKCPFSDCGKGSTQWLELLGSWGVQRLALPLAQ